MLVIRELIFHLVQFVKCWQIFPELNSKRLYQSSGKEKESRCLVFTSSTKREIRHCHVVVVLRRQQADLATERERHLTTGKRAKGLNSTSGAQFAAEPLVKLGQASCLICARRLQLTFPFCCQISLMKCTKKRDARAKLLFCQSKPVASVLVAVAVFVA